MKHVLKSKIVWTAAIMVALPIFKELQEGLDPETVGYQVLALATIVLRIFFSGKPLTWNSKADGTASTE